jgi:hypothetical protein
MTSDAHRLVALILAVIGFSVLAWVVWAEHRRKK